MKTVQFKNEIKRVSNEEADNLVSNFGWKFVPKQVWKEKVSNQAKQESSEPKVKKGKMTRSQKRNLKSK